MTDETRQRPSLNDSDTDRNGQTIGQGEAHDIGTPGSDATDDTLRRIGDAARGKMPAGAAAEAIARATASVGSDPEA